MSRPQERERGRQMRYCGSNMPTRCRNSPEVKLSRARRGQACPFLSSHSGMFVSEDFLHPCKCLSDSSFLVFDSPPTPLWKYKALKQALESCERLIIHVVAIAKGTCKIKHCFSSLGWAFVHGGRIGRKNNNLKKAYVYHRYSARALNSPAEDLKQLYLIRLLSRWEKERLWRETVSC